MVSNVGAHNVISTLSSECQRGEKFKHTWTNGRREHDFLKGSQSDVSTSAVNVKVIEIQTHAK